MNVSTHQWLTRFSTKSESQYFSRFPRSSSMAFLLDSSSADHVATSFAHIINTTHPILALQKPARVEGLVLYEGHAFEYMNSVHGVKVCVWY